MLVPVKNIATTTDRGSTPCFATCRLRTGKISHEETRPVAVPVLGSRDTSGFRFSGHGRFEVGTVVQFFFFSFDFDTIWIMVNYGITS